jgi:hypothetical protein
MDVLPTLVIAYKLYGDAGRADPVRKEIKLFIRLYARDWTPFGMRRHGPHQSKLASLLMANI